MPTNAVIFPPSIVKSTLSIALSSVVAYLKLTFSNSYIAFFILRSGK